VKRENEQYWYWSKIQRIFEKWKSSHLSTKQSKKIWLICFQQIIINIQSNMILNQYQSFWKILRQKQIYILRSTNSIQHLFELIYVVHPHELTKFMFLYQFEFINMLCNVVLKEEHGKNISINSINKILTAYFLWVLKCWSFKQ
jgi:hypothetical protein